MSSTNKRIKRKSERAAGVFAAVYFLATSCAAQTSSPNSPIPASFFGMSAIGGSYPEVTFGLLAHGDFAWETIEPSRGVFDFSVFDNYMSLIQRHGLVDPVTNTANFAMTLAAGTPIWAVASKCAGPNSACTCTTTTCTAPPDNIADWTDFLNTLINHYNGKTQPHIKYYELWNEFNYSLWWTGGDAAMVALAKAAYPIIHQDLHSMLLTPSVSGPVGTVSPVSGYTRMKDYLQAGGYLYADGGAFHGYIAGSAGNINPFPMPEDDVTSDCTEWVTCYGSIITKAEQMRAVFDQNGLAGKPMFQTEGSWGKNTVTKSDIQVAWLSRWLLLQAGLRAELNLQMAAWFTWAPGTGFGWGTIETSSGTPSDAGIAYQHVFDWVSGATIAQRCSPDSNSTYTCTLTRAGGYTAKAVWNTKGTISYTPGAGYTQYRDLAGLTHSIAPGASIQIGAEPVLVESPGRMLPEINNGGIVIFDANSPLVSPGALVSVFGSNFASGFTAAPVGSKLPATLGGTQVLVDGRPAPLVSVNTGEIIFQMPYEAALGADSVMVISGLLPSPPAPATVAVAGPSIFTDGAGGAVVADASGYLAGSGGVKPGTKATVYLTGSGPVTPSIATGAPAPPSPASVETLPTTITVNGVAASVSSAGMTPGFVGVVQVQFVVPNLAPGSYPIQVGIGSALSNQPPLRISR